MQKLTLRPHQREDVDRWLAEPTKAILCADYAGAGKTLKAVSYALDLWVDHVLIVGIKSTYKQWADRIAAQSDGSIELKQMAAGKTGEQNIADYLSGQRGWYFIGAELLAHRDNVRIIKRDSNGEPIVNQKGKVQHKKQRLGLWAGGTGWEVVNENGIDRLTRKTRPVIKPDLIIWDEVHRQSARYTNGQDTMQGLDAEYKLLLSATPSGNRFENFHGPTSWLWDRRVENNPAIDPSFNRWRMRWCKTQNQYVPGGRAVTKVVGEKNPGEFVSYLPCYTRREDENEIPEAMQVEVDLTAEQRRIYDSLESDLLAWVGDHPWTVDWPVTLVSHLNTVTLAEPNIEMTGYDDRDVPQYSISFDDNAASSKVDKVIEMMNDELKGQPIFHFSPSKRYLKFAERRMRAAGFRVATYTGDENEAQREQVKQAFINGEIDHVLATASGSTGLDGFQVRCNTLIWHSKPQGNPTLVEQAQRRIWRQGGNLENYQEFEIVARGTRDTGIYASLALQEAAMRATLGVDGMGSGQMSRIMSKKIWKEIP